MDITYEVETAKDELLSIDFHADYSIQNDSIGWYEFHGSREYDAGQDYPELKGNITWNKSLYTDAQNEAINNFIHSSESMELESLFLEQAEKLMNND